MYKEAQTWEKKKVAIFKKKKASLQLKKRKKKKKKQPARKEVAEAVSEINNVLSPLAEGVIGCLQ